MPRLASNAQEVDDWITPSADGADDWITPQAPETPSGTASFAHAAERGVAPAVGGWAGMVAGAKLGAIAGAFVPGLGETGLSEAAGAVIGGVAGGVGGGWLAGKTQEEVLDRIPEDVKEKIGQSKTQREAEELAHPYLSMAGELVPNVALLRPGAIAKTAREGAGLLERTLTHPVGARAVGAGFNAAQEAGTELATDGDVDPGKVAIAAGAGALMTHETALGRGIRTKIEGAFPGARIHPGPSPEETAVPVLEAGSVDEAIAAANEAVNQPVLDVGAMGETARQQGEANAASEAAASFEAAPGAAVPENLEIPIERGESEPIAAEIDPEASMSGPETPEAAPEEITPVTQPSAREFQPFADAKTKADTYNRWLGELDAQRREQAAASPRARFLQQNIAAILNKVNGVEDRLTHNGAQRLSDARQDLDELLNPVGDSPDMARVRASMVVEQQNMADAVVAHRDQALVRAQQAREQAKVLGENLTEEEAEQIASHMTDHQIDAVTAVADHIERKAIEEIGSDHGTTGDRSYAEALPVRGGEGQADHGAGESVQRPEIIPGNEGGESPPAATIAQDTGAAHELTRFTTAKGSTYEVHQDGTTTRNKAARPDPGHEGQFGPQPRSEHTFYVTTEHADQLGLFQTQGGDHMAVAARPDGTVGVKYLDGQNAGKFERRTVAKAFREPGPGLIPVETWKGGTRVHFGNEIAALGKREVEPADIGTPQTRLRARSGPEGNIPAEREAFNNKAPAEPPPVAEPPNRAKALRAIEGTGEERERAVNQELYHVGEEKPQLEAASALVEKDFEHAIAVAMRQKQPPAGIHPEFVYMAVEAKAAAAGDVDLMRRLSKSKIAEEATTMGQRIAAYRNRDEISPVEDMRRIDQARAEKIKGRGTAPEKAVDTMVKDAQAQIRKSAKSSKRTSWNDFVLSLSCST